MEGQECRAISETTEKENDKESYAYNLIGREFGSEAHRLERYQKHLHNVGAWTSIGPQPSRNISGDELRNE